MQRSNNHTPLYILLGISVLVNFSGLFVPLMDPDAGVYASISRTMAENNDFVNLYFQGKDWLDKPHFPFWITAAFFEVLGVHDWVYKLPGVLFVMMGARYTYLFARKYYSETVALWSAFILLTAFHIIISNNDVRAEPFLTGLIIAAIYHFSNVVDKNNLWQLLAACFFTACAVMTKGIFTLIPIGGAVAGELLLRRDWKQIFHWKWIAALLLVALFILPELYCLWSQFDTHPEKQVLGSRNVSGIRFFFWDSQFGRFFNTGPIRGSGDKFFFLHTLLWAFLPWSLILYASVYTGIRNAIRKTAGAIREGYTLAGSLLALLIFSFSGFQLPHYSNIVFPLLAIPCALFIVQQVEDNKKGFGKLQQFISLMLMILAMLLWIIYSPSVRFVHIASGIILLGLLAILPRLLRSLKGFVSFAQSGIAMLAVALFLNLLFYPDLLKYQAGNEAAFYINRHFPERKVVIAGVYEPAFDFYIKKTPVWKTDAGPFPGADKTTLWYVSENMLETWRNQELNFLILKEFRNFHVTMLTPGFLNKKTRDSTLSRNYLVTFR